MNRGKLFYEMGDHPKALTDITRTIELNPDFIYAWQLRGDVYTAMGRSDEAEADFAKVKELMEQYESGRLAESGD